MKRVTAKQAESERERRAKVIHAEGEFQAAAKLRDAAETIKDHPMALQLRYLQTLAEVGGGTNNTTVAFPLPIDIFSALTQGIHPNGAHQPREPHEKPFGPMRR